MPKTRLPREVWNSLRIEILSRDAWQCVRCQLLVSVSTGHVDHIQSGKRGTNHPDNLRTLCRRCHVLRADHRHQGMIASALRDGIIPPDWRHFVWD